MPVRNYRLSEYRLAAYVVVAAVIAGGVAFALDRAFAPATKVQANGAPGAVQASSAPVANAPGAVRQIPIARTSAADLGDPEGKLTPVYPANPGKDLPVKDTPIIQPTKPVVAATTTGSASTDVPLSTPAPVANAATTAPAPQASAAPQATVTPQAQATSQAQTTPQANACNIAACSAAYRSFRESDCTYQPYDGPRRICEASPDNDNAQTAAAPSSQPPQPQQARRQFETRSAPQISRRSYEDALRDAERTVRRLPAPSRFDDEDPRGIVVMESPEQRYDLRRNWIVESGD